MEIFFTLLYCVLACLQIYILMSIGFIAQLKKIITPTFSSSLSKILLSLIIPLYFTLQLCEVVDMEILKTFWILIINSIIELICGYFLSKLFHVALKMDVRIKESFSAMNMIPALGAFPLVIAKGFCFPSGPIETDPFCKNFLGIVMLCLLVFNVCIYLLSFIMFSWDKNCCIKINFMLQILNHKFMKKFFNKNLTVFFLFKKFVKNDVDCFNLFENFEKKFDFSVENEEKIKEYYFNVLDIVESNLNENKKNEFEIEKKKIFDDLINVPQKLPFTKNIEINNEKFNFLKEEFKKIDNKLILNEYEKNINSQKIEFKFSTLLNRIITAPIISILFGIILVVSKNNLIIFNSKNLYWSNIMNGFKLLINTYTPFIFGTMGISCVNSYYEDKSEIISNKKHIFVQLIIKFLLLPFIGIFNIFMWKKFYGGIVKESTAYRLIMYSHWCLPPPANMTLIVHLTGFFGKEFGYLVFICNVFSIVGLTILHLIYFILVGLN